MAKIVVGIDEGVSSEVAFLKALSTFDKTAVTFTLVHVRPDHTQYRVDALYGFKKHWDALESQRKESASSVIEKFRKIGEAAGVTFEIVEVEGDARTELCNFCERSNADLLVLGHEGETGLKRLAMGSVSSYCSSHVHCSVMINRCAQYPATAPAVAAA